MEEYVSFRKMEGLSKGWIDRIRSVILSYLEFCNWSVNKSGTIAYMNRIGEEYSKCTYRKCVLQIRRFLRYYELDYLDKLKIVKEPLYTPQRVTSKDIERAMRYFSGKPYDKQMKALIQLGASSGLRPFELYRLKLEDIDLRNRTIFVRKSKTGEPRVTFFTNQAKKYLKRYLSYFEENSKLKCLFGMFHLQNNFKKAPIQVKQLRKYFSQEWDRRGGNYSAKERLMGHSLNRVDFQHYSFLSEKDLKRVYDKVMNR